MAPCVLLLPRVNTWVVEGWKDGRGMGLDEEGEDEEEEGGVEGERLEEEEGGGEESEEGESEGSREENGIGDEEERGWEDEEGGAEEEGEGREGRVSGEWASFEQLMAVVESQLSSSAALLLHSFRATAASIHVVVR
ncbi:unnamed protein product [Closterium sp. NIES-53]